MHTHTFQYKELRNAGFSRNFAYVFYGWSWMVCLLMLCKMLDLDSKVSWPHLIIFVSSVTQERKHIFDDCFVKEVLIQVE